LEIRLDPSASAWDEWKRAFKELKAFLKHDNGARITAQAGELEELPDRGQLSAQAQEFFKKRPRGDMEDPLACLNTPGARQRGLRGRNKEQA
jgi:hypothetical protein